MTTTGNCFRCGEPGHWIRDCTLKSNADDPSPSIHCPCGGGYCEAKVSNTRENPGRRFYNCPAAQSCRFFMWCDEITDEHIRFRPSFIIPTCPCGSGPCRRITVDSGPNSGRAYLLCCIKKGFGACGFFQWEDVKIPPSCDALDEIEMDFWVEADLISSDVESSFQACVSENANQVAPPPEKECQGSVTTEDDSILENVDAMFVSDIHSAAANQGIPLLDPTVSEDQVAVVIEPDEPWMKTLVLPGDKPINCSLSKFSLTESNPLNADEAMSDLGSVSSGSTWKHETTNHEEPVLATGESEWPSTSGPYFQDLIDQYNSEKLQLESVTGKHVQVLSAFMGSYSRLRLLHEKTCYLRTKLLETEKEMSCCEAETLEFGASCREVAGEMGESQKRMQETAEKLGKEVEVLKQKEFVAMKRRRC